MSGASAHEVLSIRPNRSMSRFARDVLPSKRSRSAFAGGELERTAEPTGGSRRELAGVAWLSGPVETSSP
jgi:hypothetical protein